jgi:hypothetical protein
MITCCLAGEVAARVDAELLAELHVIPDAVVDGGGVLAVALERAVDVPDGAAEALPGCDPRVHVVHPVPERGPERHHGAARHRVGVAQPVEPDALPGRAVVEVPRDLQRPAPVVALPLLARILRVPRVAVVLARAVDLVDVAELCIDRISTRVS